MEPLLLSAATTVNVSNLGPEVTARKQTCKAMFDVGEYNTAYYTTTRLVPSLYV